MTSSPRPASSRFDRENIRYDAVALPALMLPAMTIAVTRFRRTLD
jgi:hypothetical protein